MRTRFLLLTMVCMLLAIGVQAQGPKIGYADANYILSLLPEAKVADAEIKSHEKMLQERLKAKYDDYQARLKEYQENGATMDEALRRNAENDLLAMQQSIQQLEQDGQTSLLTKQNELLQPLFSKIGDAIKSVSEENGYDFIFSAGAQGVDVLLYAKEEHNATNLVLKKLGIDPPTDN